MGVCENVYMEPDGKTIIKILILGWDWRDILTLPLDSKPSSSTEKPADLERRQTAGERYR